MAPANDGWTEDRVYTVIRNKTRNSKIVLSTLNGVEIAPGQTFDLRTAFRKSQVQEATHEIASLIRSGHLEDLGGDDGLGAKVPAAGVPTQDEMKSKMKEAMLREISDSTNVSFLEDQQQSKDPEIARAAKVRIEVLMGARDDAGNPIPGAEEEPATPTQLIRDSQVGQSEPVASGGVVRRAD